MEGIGPFIRKRRDELDLSFRELAKKLDCSLAFISDIELGRRHPSDKVLIEIAKILKVKSEELRKIDVRPPIEEIKRVTQDDPTFALAFRDALTGRRVLEHLSGSGLLQTNGNFSGLRSFWYPRRIPA
jgi:transcriptional regulator with XRE-family HTH domain